MNLVFMKCSYIETNVIRICSVVFGEGKKTGENPEKNPQSKDQNLRLGQTQSSVLD